jgi:LuxR family quorum sensing-dependent transcriptional regulator
MMSDEGELRYIRDAFDLMDQMEHLQDEKVVRDKMAILLARFGLDRFFVARLPQPRENILPAFMLRRWPQAWEHHYLQSGYFQHDPVGLNCFRTLKPFLWSGVRVDPQSNPQGYRVMQEAGEHGLKEGLCIPIRDAKGFQAVVSMAGERVELPPRAKRAIHLLSLSAYGAAERLAGRRGQPVLMHLTGREQDVLSYLANGLTVAQVAEVLRISETTVLTHLKNAKQKLGTRTMTHTVVEAIRQDLIRL